MSTEASKVEETKAPIRELTAEDILKVDDLQPEPLDVPEWGGRVWMRRLSAAQGMSLGKQVKLNEPGSNTKVVAMGLCRKDGTTLFSVQQAEDLEAKNLKVLNTVANKILILNGILPDPAELKKAQEEAKKD